MYKRQLGDGTAETGGNSGSNFRISAINDAGTGAVSASDPLVINRANGNMTLTGETISYSSTSNHFRMRDANQGAFWRMDDTRFYLLFTSPGDPLGIWNSLRPFYVDIATGNVVFGSDPAATKGRLVGINEFTTSLAPNGYTKLPSGIIIQWGTGTPAGGASVDITLPITFPSSFTNLQVSPVGDPFTALMGYSATVQTNSSFRCYPRYTTGATIANATQIFWYLAIGW